MKKLNIEEMQAIAEGEAVRRFEEGRKGVVSTVKNTLK